MVEQRLFVKFPRTIIFIEIFIGFANKYNFIQS